MRVVHTWSSVNPIWKEQAYIHLASNLSAKEHYGNITLVGDSNALEQTKALGIEYTATSLLDKFNYGKTFSVPKLQSFKTFRDDPYLHIDTDTILFEKLDFSFTDSPFVFSHCDKHMKNHRVWHNTSVNSILSSLVKYSADENFYSMLNEVYLKAFFKLSGDLIPEIIDRMDIFSIPNMNIVYVEQPKLFAEACEYSLEHYRKHKKFIDQLKHGASYVEQFLLHMFLRVESKKYRKRSNKLKHVLHHNNPLLQLYSDNLTTNLTDECYPINFSYENSRCRCCDRRGETGTFSIDNLDDVRKITSRDYGNYLHFSFMRWYDIWQFYVINHLVERYGEGKVMKIHNFYKTFNTKYNIPLISGGEKLYEKLTGNKLFTEKVVSYKNNAYI